jgi:tetratricopeptide (TPR) repeat protein
MELKMTKPLFTTLLLAFLLATGQHLSGQAMDYESMDATWTRLQKEKKADSALFIAKQMREWALTHEGDTSLRYAVSLRLEAGSFDMSKKTDSAILTYNTAIEILRVQGRTNHPEVASNQFGLCLIYFSSGEYDRAENLAIEALEINKFNFGEIHPTCAKNLSFMGAIYSIKGDYQNAGICYKKALDIRKSIFGENHPDVGQSIGNLGTYYMNIGEYETAEKLYKLSLEIKKNTIGETNYEFASSLNNLSIIYRRLMDYKNAEILLKRSLEIKKNSPR